MHLASREKNIDPYAVSVASVVVWGDSVVVSGGASVVVVVWGASVVVTSGLVVLRIKMRTDYQS